MAEPLQQGEIDALSADADRFVAELDEESYLHYAGLKETLDIAPIYERHERLTQLDTALALGASVDGDRRRRELWKFACSGYLGNFVSAEEERIAELEATLTATVDGEEIPFRMLRPRLINEEHRDARERIEAARTELTEEHLNRLQLQAAQVVQRETRQLGADSYADLYRSFGFPLDDLAEQCRRLLADTEDLWVEAGDRFFHRTEIGSVRVIQRGQRPGLRPQPRLVPLRPCVFGAGESPAMPQQKLRQAMARPQQVRSNIFTAAEQIACRFLLLGGDVNGGQGLGPIQDCQVRGVAAVRFHAIAWPSRNQRGRDHVTGDTVRA